MEYKVKAYNIWEVGQRFDENGMPHQEDALFPGYGRCAPEDRVFVLCDGMGGHDNGEIASSVVCDTISQSVLRQLRSGSGYFREGIFDRALAEAYDALDYNDTGSAKKMGTTMAILCLYEKGYFIAHIGDTRVYHIRPGDDEGSTQIIFSTTDHSLVNKLVASGKMSMEEAMTSTRRHVITRAMQPHMEVRPLADVEMSSDIRTGDYFVMATHGMLHGLGERDIRHIFSREGGNDREKFMRLREATANNKDNHSAVIVHIENVKSLRNSNNMATPVRSEERVRSAASAQSEGNVRKSASSRPERKDHGDNPSRSKKIVNGMIGRASRGSENTGSMRNFSGYAGKCMMALILVLSLTMVVYYAFIHKDEAMLEVGRSAASQSSDYDPNKYEEEQYGYETKVTEVIDDRILDDGTNDEPVQAEPEDEPVAEEPQPETGNRESQSEPDPEPQPEPVAEPDVPILQE